MNRAALLALAALAACGGQSTNSSSESSRALEANGGVGAQEPPMAGIHWARGEGPARPTSSPDLLYHGGPVMHGTAVQPIFWGDWSSPGDKISGLQTFYSGVGGSSYGNTNTEYTDSAGHVSSAVTLGTTHMDSSAPPGHAPRTSAILAEVCRTIASPVENGYYPVYVSTTRGHARYCAWHSAGTCNGVTVQFAFFFNLDGDPGCDPQDSSGTHSQGLAALANVSGHELSEMLTDRHLDAWYDANGAENSDKCAWTFGSNLLSFGGTRWKIQGNWSNNAYDGNSGYTDPSAGFVRGCIDGTN